MSMGSFWQQHHSMRQILTLLITCIVAWGAHPAAASTASLRARLIGTWRVNQDKSPGATLQVSKFDRDGAFLRNTNGPVNYQFKLDGQEHAAPGNPDFDAVMWRKTGPRKYEHETRKGGKLIYSVVTNVAADGMTRTAVHTAIRAGGGRVVLERVHDRVGGNRDPKEPIIGHWRLRSEWQWSAAGVDGLRYKSGMLDYTAKLDGQDHPVADSSQIDAIRLRPLSAEAFEVIGKKGGQTVYTNAYQLSADGKTMTTKASKGEIVLEKGN